MTAGWTVTGRPVRRWIRPSIWFALAGMIPDVDLVWHAHHEATHSLTAILLVAIGVWLIGTRAVRGLGRRETLGVTAAYASHILLDLLGADTTPPIGVMLLWPFSRAYFISPWTPFPAIDRRYWLPGFWPRIVQAMMFELIILAPLAAVVWWVRRQRLLRCGNRRTQA